jgi:hypothetical protein
VNQTIAFDQEVASYKQIRDAAADTGFTDEEVSSICTALSGWKDAYTVNLFLHSYPFWNRTPILPAKDLLRLVSEPYRGEISENELLHLLITAPDDYRLEDFKYEGDTSFATLWQIGDYDLQLLFAKGFDYEVLLPDWRDHTIGCFLLLQPEADLIYRFTVASLLYRAIQAARQAKELDVQALPNADSSSWRPSDFAFSAGRPVEGPFVRQ